MPGLVIVKQPGDPVVLHKDDPKVEVHKNCVYVPANIGNFWQNKFWGIYAEDGAIIDAAAFRSLPSMKLTGQNETCLTDVADAPYAPRDRYYYVGNVINHYGHFICSTMARLWALPDHGGDSLPLVGHAAGIPAHWFAWSFTPTLFGSAGVVLEDFTSFDRPTRMRELVVAYPSFVEKNLAHTAHARAAHRWGDRLVKAQDLSSSNDAIYLARTRLKTQREGIANEAQLIAELETLGVKIVYPEQLTMPEQVALYRTSKLVLGQSGSAFHTSFFSEPIEGQVLLQLVASPHLYSTNHALMDLANENNSFYLYFHGEWFDRETGGRGFNISEPATVARELLDFAHSVSRSGHRSSTMS